MSIPMGPTSKSWPARGPCSGFGPGTEILGRDANEALVADRLPVRLALTQTRDHHLPPPCSVATIQFPSTDGETEPWSIRSVDAIGRRPGRTRCRSRLAWDVSASPVRV